jgi:uncharacterized damage-inducible protein DinB
MSRSYTSLLEETLEAWEYCRDGVIEEVENIGEEGFDYRPAPESRSVRELVRHIIESGLMAVGELTRPDGDFRRQDFPDFIHEYAGHVAGVTDRGELLRMLQETQREGDRKFREAGELHMLQFIRRFDGQPGTRLAWLHHGIQHEMYHRGQLALYARLMGRVPALTQRIG